MSEPTDAELAKHEFEQTVVKAKRLKASNVMAGQLLGQTNRHNQLLIQNEINVLKEAEMVKAGTRPGSMAVLQSFQIIVKRLNQVEKGLVLFVSHGGDLDPLRTSLAYVLRSLAGAMRDNIMNTMVLKNALITQSELRTTAEKLYKANQDLKFYSKKADNFDAVRKRRDEFEKLADKLESENHVLKRKYEGAIESVKSYKEFTERFHAAKIENAITAIELKRDEINGLRTILVQKNAELRANDRTYRDNLSRSQAENYQLRNEKELLLKQVQAYQSAELMRQQSQETPYNQHSANVVRFEASFAGEVEAEHFFATRLINDETGDDALHPEARANFTGTAHGGLSEVELLARVDDLQSKLVAQNADFYALLESEDRKHRRELRAQRIEYDQEILDYKDLNLEYRDQRDKCLARNDALEAKIGALYDEVDELRSHIGVLLEERDTGFSSPGAGLASDPSQDVSNIQPDEEDARLSQIKGFVARIEELEEELQKAQVDTLSWSVEKESLQSRYLASYSRIESELFATIDKLRDGEYQLQPYQAEIIGLKSYIEDMEHQNGLLVVRAERAERNAEFPECRSERHQADLYTGYYEQLQKERADGSPPTLELAVLRDQLIKRREQLLRFRNPADDVEKDNSVQAKLEHVQQTLRQRTRRVAELEQLVHELRSVPTDQLNQLLLSQITSLEKDVQNLKNALDDAENQEHLNGDGDEVEDLKAQVSFYETQQKSSDAKLIELKKELSTAKEVVSKRDAENADHTRKNEELTVKNAELTAKLDDLGKQIAGLKLECAAAQGMAQKSMQDVEKMKVAVGQANAAAQEWCSENVVVREQNRRMSSIINSGGPGHPMSDVQSPSLRPDSLQRQVSGRYHAHRESISSAFIGLPPSDPALSSPPQDFRRLSLSIHGMPQIRRGGHIGSSLSRRTGQRFPVNPQYPRSPLPPPLQAVMMDNQRSVSMPNPVASGSAALPPRVPMQSAFEQQKVVDTSGLQSSLAALAANMAALTAKSDLEKKEALDKTPVQASQDEVAACIATVQVMSTREQEKAQEEDPGEDSYGEESTLPTPVPEKSALRQKRVPRKTVPQNTEIATLAQTMPVKSVPEQKETSAKTPKQASNVELMREAFSEELSQTRQALTSKTIGKPERINVKSGTVTNLKNRVRSDFSLPGGLRTSVTLVNLADNPFIKADRKASAESLAKTIVNKASQSLVQSRAQQFLSAAQGTQKRSASDSQSSTSPTRGRAVSEGVKKPQLNVRASFTAKLEGLFGGQ